MMRVLLTLCMALWLAGCVASERGIPEDHVTWSRFGEFILKFDRSYISPAEKLHRFDVFKAGLARIDQLNAEHKGRTTFVVTQFTDLTPEEFVATYCQYNGTNAKRVPVGDVRELRNLDIPQTRDWRGSLVTSVKNQYTCGSCWAFTVSAELEGRALQYGGYSGSLSPQQLVDCSTQDNGCTGGDLNTGLSYAGSANGIALLTAYPYINRQNSNPSCRLTASMPKYWYNGGANGPLSWSNIFTQVGTNRPAAAALDATTLQYYGGGIVDVSSSCGGDLNHAVLIAGYNNANNPNYFIVKNSWGTAWGYSGYFYINVGACGISTHVYNSDNNDD